MDFDDVLEEKGKYIFVLVGLFLIIAVGALAVPILTPSEMRVYFTSNVIQSGEGTSLIVEIRNMGNEDLFNVITTITPESDKIMVVPNTKTESVIGKGAYRKVEFNIMTIKGTTPGSYKIKINSEDSLKQFLKEQTTYLEVTKD